MLEWLRLRLRALLRKGEVESELDEELRAHLEREIEQNVRYGMSTEEARYAALKNFGGLEQAKEQCRDARGVRMIEEFWQDLHYGARMLLKQPGFTLIAVLTLALGIGANTAVFTLINALLLRALPVTNPHELAVINATNTRSRVTRGGAGIFGSLSFPMYRDLRARQEVFTDILASGGVNSVRLTIPAGAGTGEVDNVQTSLVAGNYWGVLGVQPALGRFFTEDEDRDPNSSETAGSLAVLSYSFWERQFGSDPEVLDRMVIVNRSPCRVIGVAPRGFFGERGRPDDCTQM